MLVLVEPVVDMHVPLMSIDIDMYKYAHSIMYSSIHPYNHPDEDDEPDDRFQMGRYPGGGRPSSRQAMRTTSIVEASLMQSLKKIDMPDQGSAPRDRSTDSPTTYYSEQLIESDDESLQRSKGSGQNTKVNGSVGSISQKRVDSNSQPVHTEKEAHQGERAEQDPQIEDRNVCETLSEDDKPADHFKGGLETYVSRSSHMFSIKLNISHANHFKAYLLVVDYLARIVNIHA